MSPITEAANVAAHSKDTIALVMTWFAGSISHILNKVRKGEKMSFTQHISHIVISWFVWYLAYLACQYYWIDWPREWIVIWMSTYSAIQIVETIEMIKAKFIFNTFLNYLRFTIWKK